MGRAAGASRTIVPDVAAERFMRRVAGDDVWEALPAATRARRLDEGRALVAELASARRAAPFVASEITRAGRRRPGVGDRRLPRAGPPRSSHEQMPDAELVLLDGADHGAHVSRPDDFAAPRAHGSGPLDGRSTRRPEALAWAP